LLLYFLLLYFLLIPPQSSYIDKELVSFREPSRGGIVSYLALPVFKKLDAETVSRFYKKTHYVHNLTSYRLGSRYFLGSVERNGTRLIMYIHNRVLAVLFIVRMGSCRKCVHSRQRETSSE
jgi:hypothetical protein